MKIFFVRHAESALNSSGVHQFSQTPLSEKGLKQAEVVAKRLRDGGADVHEGYIKWDNGAPSDYERRLGKYLQGR